MNTAIEYDILSKFLLLLSKNKTSNFLNAMKSEYSQFSASLKIEAATDIPAYIWINMQSAYNMQMARHDSKLSAILDNIRKSVAVF